MHFKGDVLLQNGKIEKIIEWGKKHDNIPGVQTIDATNKLVIPGGIDPHTHCELPFMGTTAADDFNMGTQACVAGGTTTILDFIIPDHGESLISAYNRW